MAILVGDMQSVGTAGWFINTAVVGTSPTEPELSVVNDGTGTSVTAAVVSDAGVTNTLYYRTLADSAWTEGADRIGSGDIAQAGLTNGTWYDFVVVSDDAGILSLPSACVGVYVSDGASIIERVSDAVTAALNAESFSLAFTAVRVLVPVLKLKDTDTLHVLVAPRARTITRLTRGSDWSDVEIDVGILQRPSDITNANTNPLLALVEEMQEFLTNRDMDIGAWRTTLNDPIHIPEHLQNLTQFTSVIRITYGVGQTPI